MVKYKGIEKLKDVPVCDFDCFNFRVSDAGKKFPTTEEHRPMVHPSTKCKTVSKLNSGRSRKEMTRRSLRPRFDSRYLTIWAIFELAVCSKRQ
jgi:hypothetical protein